MMFGILFFIVIASERKQSPVGNLDEGARIALCPTLNQGFIKCFCGWCRRTVEHPGSGTFLLEANTSFPLHPQQPCLAILAMIA